MKSFNGFKKLISRVSLILVVLFTLVIAGKAVYAQATRSNITFEAEQGALTGQAAIVSDLLASSSFFVNFNTVTTPPPGVQFQSTFNTAADFYDRFRIDVHFRDEGPNVDRVKTWPGDHNMNCEGPLTTRIVSAANEADLFWWCAPGDDPTKGHIMTSMGDVDGYTILSFSPNQSFTNINMVCWDVNLTYEGGRKWTQVGVIPRAAFEASGSRLDYISPLTQDVDQTAERLPTGSFMYQNWDGKFRIYQGQTEVLFDWVQFFTSDKAKRYKHCITDNNNGTVTVSREQDDGTHTRTVNGSLPNDAIVIFQDDNYTPDKDGEAFPNYTWHWDNILIE
jgi:hypothetical protein